MQHQGTLHACRMEHCGSVVAILLHEKQSAAAGEHCIPPPQNGCPAPLRAAFAQENLPELPPGTERRQAAVLARSRTISQTASTPQSCMCRRTCRGFRQTRRRSRRRCWRCRRATPSIGATTRCTTARPRVICNSACIVCRASQGKIVRHPALARGRASRPSFPVGREVCSCCLLRSCCAGTHAVDASAAMAGCGSGYRLRRLAVTRRQFYEVQSFGRTCPVEPFILLVSAAQAATRSRWTAWGGPASSGRW